MANSLAASASMLAQLMMPCAENHVLQQALMHKYNEVPVGSAVTNQEQPLIVFSNPHTKTFTIIIRMSNGFSCIVAAGDNYSLEGSGL